MPSPLFQEVYESVRAQLAGVEALALVSLDGGVVEQLTADSTFNPDTLSEFATILRIAQHTSEDTAAGQLPKCHGLSTGPWSSHGVLREKVF